MISTQSYRLNEPSVIQEVIDGEAIIVDLGRGFYYSLDSLGSRVWQALVAGSSLAAITKSCASHYSMEEEEVAEAIKVLVDRLTDEQLLVVRDEGCDEGSDLAGLLQATSTAWTQPQLSKYTDMEQLLLLDPIHEVDETGWPNEPAKGT